MYNKSGQNTTTNWLHRSAACL